MSEAVLWFLSLAIASVMCFGMGLFLGHQSHRRAWLTIAVGFLGLGSWVWLQRQPAVAVEVFTPNVMSYLEGTAAAPLFMLITGAVWALAQIPRQRYITGAAIAVGIFYFVFGGIWMIQTKPASVRADLIENNIVMQSEEFTCVPAACATALRQLGISTSESEMADLTRTRIGTGATLIRALDGLSRRLEKEPITPKLLEMDYETLSRTPKPIVTALAFDFGYQHMVVIERVHKHAVLIADPVTGWMLMSKQEFLDAYGGQGIIFEQASAATTAVGSFDK